MEQHFERLKQPTVTDLGIWQTFISKMNEVSISKEINWWWNSRFWMKIVCQETCICHHDIGSFPFVKGVSGEVDSDT